MDRTARTTRVHGTQYSAGGAGGAGRQRRNGEGDGWDDNGGAASNGDVTGGCADRIDYHALDPDLTGGDGEGNLQPLSVYDVDIVRLMPRSSAWIR